MTRSSVRLCHLALAVSTALFISQAHADSAFSTSYTTHFSWELYDLDPNDNITPSISFRDSEYSASSTYAIYTDRLQTIETDRTRQSGSTEVIRPFGSAVTVTTDQEQSARSEVNGGYASPHMYARNYVRYIFDLSPSTGVKFTLGVTQTSMSAEDGDWAYADVYMQGEMIMFGDPSDNYWFNTNHKVVGNGSESFVLTGQLEANATSSRLGDLIINHSASADINSGPSPIPEPATYGMLLLGAGVVGASVRRRRN